MNLLKEISDLTNNLLNENFEKTSSSVSQGQKDKEKEACLRWQKNKNQQDFDFLLKSLQPIINRQITKYSLGSPVPKSSFKSEAIKLFVQALNSYKPSMGTNVSTHLHNYLQKLYRHNLSYQNIGRISSEAVSAKINTFRNRKSFLEDKLGRPPTGIELADEMGMSIKDVERIERDDRPDIFVGSQHWVPAESMASSKFMDKLNYLYMFDTNPKEKLILEYTYGKGGKPMIKSNIEIAKLVGVTPNRVSQIKSKLAKKLGGK